MTFSPLVIGSIGATLLGHGLRGNNSWLSVPLSSGQLVQLGASRFRQNLKFCTFSPLVIGSIGATWLIGLIQAYNRAKLSVPLSSGQLVQLSHLPGNRAQV